MVKVFVFFSLNINCDPGSPQGSCDGGAGLDRVRDEVRRRCPVHPTVSPHGSSSVGSVCRLAQQPQSPLQVLLVGALRWTNSCVVDTFRPAVGLLYGLGGTLAGSFLQENKFVSRYG